PRDARGGHRAGLRLSRQRHGGQGRRLAARGLRLQPQPRRAGTLHPGVRPRRRRSLRHPLLRHPHDPVHRQGHGRRRLVRGLAPPGLAEGDLVVPETVVSPTGARYATAEVGSLRRAGTLVTVDEVVATPGAKARLWVETAALACDMESAAILEWARARGIPAVVIRAVSDTAVRGVPADLAAVVESDGRVRTMRAVRAVLARPRAFVDALTLRSGTN